MTPTDFDLVCTGASAEETRRLSKMLRVWSDGDENGFPAQLALLTRSQWRAAATVPGAVATARKELELRFAAMQSALTTQIADAERVLTARAEGLKGVVEDHQTKGAAKIQEMNACVAQMESVAKKVKQDLEAGARKWDAAVKEYETVHRRVNQVIADLESRPWRSHWVMGVLLLVAAALLGHAAARLNWVAAVMGFLR